MFNNTSFFLLLHLFRKVWWRAKHSTVVDVNWFFDPWIVTWAQFYCFVCYRFWSLFQTWSFLCWNQLALILRYQCFYFRLKFRVLWQYLDECSEIGAGELLGVLMDSVKEVTLYIVPHGYIFDTQAYLDKSLFNPL